MGPHQQGIQPTARIHVKTGITRERHIRYVLFAAIPPFGSQSYMSVNGNHREHRMGPHVEKEYDTLVHRRDQGHTSVQPQRGTCTCTYLGNIGNKECVADLTQPGVAREMQHIIGRRNTLYAWGPIAFHRGHATPRVLYHEAPNLRVTVQGGDVTVPGFEEALDWFKRRMASNYEVKFRGRIGLDPKDEHSILISSMTIEWNSDGILYEAYQRNADIIVDTRVG